MPQEDNGPVEIRSLRCMVLKYSSHTSAFHHAVVCGSITIHHVGLGGDELDHVSGQEAAAQGFSYCRVCPVSRADNVHFSMFQFLEYEFVFHKMSVPHRLRIILWSVT